MTLQQRIDADIALAYQLYLDGREEESVAISKVVTELRRPRPNPAVEPFRRPFCWRHTDSSNHGCA